jgi:hypothetical protein
LAQQLARDPSTKRPPDIDHDRVLATLERELNAVDQAMKLLEREKVELVRTLSMEAFDRVRPDYLTHVVGVHEAGMALLRALDQEEQFASQLLGAGLVPGSFNRITLDFGRRDLELLRGEAKTHYQLDLGQDQPEPPPAQAPGKSRPRAATVAE